VVAYIAPRPVERFTNAYTTLNFTDTVYRFAEDRTNMRPVKLPEALSSDLSIRLSCKNCGAHQPAYIQKMIDKHGSDTELEVALRRAECIFCETIGDFTAFIMKMS